MISKLFAFTKQGGRIQTGLIVALSFVMVPAWADLDDYSISSDKGVGYGADHTFLEWHGYLNFEFDSKQGTHSNFDMHEFYLSAQANISNTLSVTAEFEYEHAPEKLILPIQAYLDNKINDHVSWRAGIFFVPIGIPRTDTLRGNKNRMIRQVALTHDIMFENWALVGVEAYGEFDIGSNAKFHWDVATGNGSPDSIGTGDSWFNSKDSLQDHSEDNNDNKAIMGRFGVSFTGSSYAADVGFSYSDQKYDDDDLLTMTHTGVDVRWQNDAGYRVQAEWMDRGGDDRDPLDNPAISVDASSWYVQVSKRWHSAKTGADASWYEVVLQMDEIDLNEATDTNGDKTVSAIAFNYSPQPFLILKAEYDFVTENAGADVDNDVFWLSAIAEF